MTKETVPAIHVLLRALEEEGVRYIFGVPGGPLVPIFEALDQRQQIQPILAKHEEGAAFMAEGYARVRRGLGVCFGTSGPGATNALTGVASAHSDSTPLLAITGQVATKVFGKGGLQDSSSGNWNVDVVDAYRAATKLSLMLNNGEQMPHMARRMIRTALTGRPGAVHLSIPADVVKQPVQTDTLPISKYYTDTVAAGDPLAIRRVAEALYTAKRPVILAGHGTNISGAWEPLLRLAEALYIPVATTVKGKSAFPEQHELSLGVFGFGGHPLAEKYLYSEDVDVLLVVGSSLGEFQTNGWDPRLAYNRMVIQIDLDPLEIGKNYPVDMSVVGDARAILQALADEIPSEPPVRVKDIQAHLEDLRTEEPRYYQAEALQREAPILKPQAVVTKMNEILPPETLIFVDNGNCISWIGRFYEARNPGTVFLATNVASMGYSVAASIGGKFAAPDKPVVAVLGDGAFAMHGLEVHTAVEYDLPVIYVVINNGGHGMVYNGETLLNGKSYLTVFKRPLDIGAIAQSMGAQAFKVDTLEAFDESLKQALESKKPCVLDVWVDLEEIPRSLQQRADLLTAAFAR